MKNVNLIGTKINNLKIINYFTKSKDNKKSKQYFDCICFCGNKFTARTDAIKSGATKSCGCITSDLISSQNRLPDNLGTFNLVLRHYKGNAKKRDLSFDLSNLDFKKLIFNNCYYCDSPPTLSTFTSSDKNRRDREIVCNGIDRINSNLGYVTSNCVTCCHICNRAKSNIAPEEFQDWIKRLINKYEKLS